MTSAVAATAQSPGRSGTGEPCADDNVSAGGREGLHRICAFEELFFLRSEINPLGSRLFLNGDKSVTQLFGLSFELGLESLFALRIAGGPDGFVVLQLVFHDGIEDSRDLVCRRSGGCCRSEFGLRAYFRFLPLF